MRLLLALSLLAVVLIIAAPVAAQTYQTPPAQEQTPPAQDLNQPPAEPAPPVQEERTNPNSPALTGDSGLTITGSVVSFTDTALVLDTAVGQQTIQLDNRTSKPAMLHVGDRVTVDFVRNSTGVMIATAIRPEGATTTESGVAVSTETGTATETAPPVESSVQTEETTTTSATEGESALPETGSELPLAGLIGLLALAGAAGLRAARRNA
jgi:LPXTG-motif cell wall-anchored protein